LSAETQFPKAVRTLAEETFPTRQQAARKFMRISSLRSASIALKSRDADFQTSAFYYSIF
jgi:hypothetical protein